MAEENQDGQEKTEEPSQRKINKAKEDLKKLKRKRKKHQVQIQNEFLLLH